MKLESAPIKTEAIDKRLLFTLPWDKWFNRLVDWINSIETDVVPVAHVAATVEDTSSINLSISSQKISGVVLPAGVDHSGLANLNSGDINHATAAQIALIQQILTHQQVMSRIFIG